MVRNLQTIEVKGERFVLVPEVEFRRVRRLLGELPELPEPSADGMVDALAFGRASLGQDLILARRKAGMTQGELAKRAGVRQETVSRIESGKHRVRPATYEKLWKSLTGGNRKTIRKTN